MLFFTRFSFAFRTVYISVSLFHVHLVLVYRPCSRFPESDFQHFVSRLLYRLFCIFLLVFTLLLFAVCYFVVIHFMFISRNLPC